MPPTTSAAWNSPTATAGRGWRTAARPSRSSPTSSARSARTPRSARRKYIRIGARTFINFNFTALDVAAITIGDDVQIGPNVQLLTPTHPLEPGPRRDKLEAAKPITIGNNVWIGGGAIILPGVTVGENSVVGAGSVVTKDVPANVVAVGNPARVIRSL